MPHTPEIHAPEPAADELAVGVFEDIVIRADAKGTILFVSDSCIALGYEPHELIGLSGETLVHPDDWAKFQANTASLFDPNLPNKPADRVHRYRHHDGSWVWLRGQPSILPSHDGRQGDILNVFQAVIPSPEAGQA